MVSSSLSNLPKLVHTVILKKTPTTSNFLWSQSNPLILAPSYCFIHFCFMKILEVTGETRPESLKRAPTSRSGEKERLRVTAGKALVSHFGLNPIWLTSTEEIKAAICLKSLNNVRQSVKHTPAALYIMHRRPAEGLLRRDNMTYPQERGGRDSYRMEIEEEMRAGQQQGFNKSLQSTVCS